MANMWLQAMVPRLPKWLIFLSIKCVKRKNNQLTHAVRAMIGTDFFVSFYHSCLNNSPKTPRLSPNSSTFSLSSSTVITTL
ncbi:hypothetical protein [Moraxella lacunata]|uniref:hypothetical protein n=1 Tax=Moraxella lacunata TaxID=477 RepID=UPI003EE3037B